jgi:PhzF family phenazine biosynthesis protein
MRVVDAFTDRPFAGNSAAVLVLDDMPSDEWLAAVAREMNVPDTGFVIGETLPDADFRLRWFTPTVEIDLCGHATLASAHCLFEDGERGPIRFATRSGVLTVDRLADGSLAMDFPAWPPTQIEARAEVSDVLGVPVQWTGLTENEVFLLALLADEGSVRELSPDLTAVSQLAGSALIVTAVADPAQGYDFISRVFAPDLGIPEDPVTGSAHTVLAPFWSDRLGRTSLVGVQASARPGEVGVEIRDDRVTVRGRAVTVLDGLLTAAAEPT